MFAPRSHFRRFRQVANTGQNMNRGQPFETMAAGAKIRKLLAGILLCEPSQANRKAWRTCEFSFRFEPQFNFASTNFGQRRASATVSEHGPGPCFCCRRRMAQFPRDLRNCPHSQLPWPFAEAIRRCISKAIPAVAGHKQYGSIGDPHLPLLHVLRRQPIFVCPRCVDEQQITDPENSDSPLPAYFNFAGRFPALRYRVARRLSGNAPARWKFLAYAFYFNCPAAEICRQILRIWRKESRLPGQRNAL